MWKIFKKCFWKVYEQKWDKSQKGTSNFKHRTEKKEFKLETPTNYMMKEKKSDIGE